VIKKAHSAVLDLYQRTKLERQNVHVEVSYVRTLLSLGALEYLDRNIVIGHKWIPLCTRNLQILLN